MGTALLKPGDRISEYLLEEKIGQGGFGEVWRARHHLWADQQVAVKIPLHADWVRKLKKEGMIQHDLGGDGVVKTLGLDPDNDPPYLILEYIDGGSLRDQIDKEGRFPVARALEIAADTMRILVGAHAKGITHGDIKPENILMESTGKVLLADFGLSQMMQEAAQDGDLAASLFTQQGEGIQGTIAYMSPEQKDPRRPVDHRTDIYSLGLVFFEMLTGSLPEGGEVPSDLHPGLPVEVDRFFRRCYARLEKRFASAADALEELERLGRTTATVKPPPLPAPPEHQGLLTEKEAASFLRIDIVQFRRQTAGGWLSPIRLQTGEEGFRLADLAPIRRKIRDELLKPVGQRGPHQAHYAGYLVRSTAFVIDSLAVIVVPISWPLELSGLFVAIPGLALIMLAHGVVGHGVWGKTLGKAILGLRVVRRPGQEMGAGTAVVRSFGKIFSFLPFFMGFFMAGLHPQKRALHDLIAETWVIHDKRSK
ncbi:MAG: protein kinase [Planctomycetota bacterium]|nr:protein kinase [Planctomycetota bacterium]